MVDEYRGYINNFNQWLVKRQALVQKNPGKRSFSSGYRKLVPETRGVLYLIYSVYIYWLVVYLPL